MRAVTGFSHSEVFLVVERDVIDEFDRGYPDEIPVRRQRHANSAAADEFFEGLVVGVVEPLPAKAVGVTLSAKPHADADHLAVDDRCRRDTDADAESVLELQESA